MNNLNRGVGPPQIILEPYSFYWWNESSINPCDTFLGKEKKTYTIPIFTCKNDWQLYNKIYWIGEKQKENLERGEETFIA